MSITGNRQFATLPTTVFTVMSALAVEHDAINLGQGFPDTDGPADIKAAAARALIDGPNQYPPMRGLASLRQAVADHDRRFHGLDIDPERGVLVTSGATEALTAAILALVNPGDEVIVFEPVYDSYLPIIRAAGAVPRVLRLAPPAWRLPEAALRAACSDKTRLIIVNSPHNPCGTLLGDDELDLLTELACRHDIPVLCDEVYEHLVFDGARHVPLMTRPGMAARCLRVGSAGKTFSLTGWKVGYLSGAPALIDLVAKVHQFLTFTTPPALQAGVAYGLALPDDYFTTLAADMQARRDRLARGLAGLGFEVLPSAGSYFLTCGYGRFADCDDTEFALRLVREARVATIPLSAFYDQPVTQRLIRFCFCKQEAVLDAAVERLRRYLTRG
ncbi:aminotransferase [Parapedomonas caeni]